MDRFTETTTESWFSRIGESFKSVLFGLLLFIIAFPLLFWNEGRAVRTAQSLTEGKGAVVSAPPDKVDPANANKLIHLTGQATSTETVQDVKYNVKVAAAIRLIRTAETYQWKEEKETRTRTKVGGSTEKTTTYEYKKVWSAAHIDSSAFKKPEGHENRPASVTSDKFTARKVTLGAYTLPEGLIDKIDKTDPVSADESALPVGVNARIDNGAIYLGLDPASPAIGDTRVKFTVIKPQTVSVIAQQTADTLQPYATKAGDPIFMLSEGTVGADAMFQAAQDANATLTWILRAVGWFIMFLGMCLMFSPLTTFASVLPFLGDMLGFGVGLLAFAVSACLSLVVIAIAWIVYRPLVGIALLVVAIGVLFGAKGMARGKAAC